MSPFDVVIDRKKTSSAKWDFINGKVDLSELDLLPMSVSDYDFQAPKIVLDELRNRIDHGVFGYSKRNEEYFGSLIDWYRKRHNVFINKQQVLTIHGVLPGLSLLLRMLSEKGDSVVIQSPGYGSFRKIIELNDRKVIENPLIENNGDYQLDFNHLELCFKQGAKILIFCNPHNPTGRVWSQEEILTLVKLCDFYNVYLLSDEIWGDLSISHNSYYSVLRVPNELAENIIVATAASKTFGLSSLRISNFIVPNVQLYENFERCLDAHGMDVFNCLSMNAATIAYQQCEQWLEDLKLYLKDNIFILNEFLLENLPLVKFNPPQATYLAWLDCRKLNLCDDLLENKLIEAGLIVTMGYSFGIEGKGFIRLNLGCPKETLYKSLDRLKLALS